MPTDASQQSPPAVLEHALATRLKLRHLELVLAVAQHRSLSRVARELGLSQPAVTTALRQVEEIFDTQLFHRASGGMLPTSAGEAVIGYAKRSHSELQATTKALASIAAGHAGRIRLGVAHGTSQTLLTAAFTHLVAGQERVAVVTREGTTDELVRALMDRELDCAIGRSYDGDSPGVIQHALYPQEGCLLTAAPTARRLSRGELTLAHLAGLDWVMPPANTPMRRAYNAMFTSAGIAPPTPILETISRRAVSTVLRVCPNAIAILSREVANDLAGNGDCAVLPFRLAVAQPHIAFFARAEMHAFPILTSLLAVLKQTGEQKAKEDSRRPAVARVKA
jgi:DNA-binding transcriptional LysR family regulator